jgi:hypothetical protein
VTAQDTLTIGPTYLVRQHSRAEFEAGDRIVVRAPIEVRAGNAISFDGLPGSSLMGSYNAAVGTGGESPSDVGQGVISRGTPAPRAAEPAASRASQEEADEPTRQEE